MKDDNSKKALADLLQIIVQNPITMNGGTSTLIVIIVNALIKQGVLNRDLMLKELEEAINAFTLEQRKSPFAMAFFQLAHSLALDRYPQNPDIQYPDCEAMIRNLPPFQD